MQENKRSGLKTWLQEKGYYIVLVLCVAAVGISGYLYFTRNNEKTSEPSQRVSAPAEDVPVSVTEPELSKPKTPAKQQPDTTEKPQAPTEQAEPAEQTLSIAWPVDGTLQQSFAMDHLAYNATTQDWRVHNGVDLAAALGAQVTAAADGTVTAIMDDDFLGKTIVVSHAGDYATRYSNLAEEVLVDVGDTVRAGQAIATVGQSAMLELADAPHIHFAVTKGEQSLNPETLLPEP